MSLLTHSKNAHYYEIVRVNCVTALPRLWSQCNHVYFVGHRAGKIVKFWVGYKTEFLKFDTKIKFKNFLLDKF